MVALQNSLPLIISLSAFVVVLVICAYYIRIWFKKEIEIRTPLFGLDRSPSNPILSPQELREWEHSGTFNPAALLDDEGRIHLLYRAIGGDGISRIGHASSSDGVKIDERSMYPVYEPLPGYGMPSGAATGPRMYNPSFYTSGGGWGGSEDPRLVRIGDRVYMTYIAFEGWNSIRIALTSISLRDFKKKHWNWRRAAHISPPGQVNKNWVIFPEKINGMFTILHGISPNILVDYVHSLDALGDTEFIKSHPPKGGRQEYWDNWVRGAGPPPMKTSKGWLLLYHAMDRDDPNKYKMGAMLLDLKDPTKVLYRSPLPILEPNAHYENDGKPGVVYASGAVIVGDRLMVYYGGGDRHVCIAETPLSQLLNWMVEYGKV